MKQQRIDRLLEARTLEASPASDDEVVAIWSGALRVWADSQVPGLTIPGAYVYQADFRAATATLRAAGYRLREAVGSHCPPSESDPLA